MKYRGAQVGLASSQLNLDDLYAAGANAVRWMLYYAGDDLPGWETAVNFYVGELQNRTCKNVILDMHSLPGGVHHLTARVFLDRDLKRALINKWVDLATVFKNDSKILAYDLCNELAGTASQCNSLQAELVTAIRSVDPNKPILITSPHGNPTFYSKVRQVKDPNVWYTAHMYYNLPFTHQGIGDRPKGKTYPTDKLNKETLKEHLLKLRTFQKQYNAKVLIGEFGASIYADSVSRGRWFKACIEIFESYGWSWIAHAWKESFVWDLEQEPVLSLLKKYWAKNE